MENKTLTEKSAELPREWRGTICEYADRVWADEEVCVMAEDTYHFERYCSKKGGTCALKKVRELIRQFDRINLTDEEF